MNFLQHFATDGKVANFDLQNIFGKGYNEYRIYLKIIDGGGGGYMGLRVYDNSDTLVSGNEYQYASVEQKSNTGFDKTWFGSNADQIAPIVTGVNASKQGGGAVIRVFNADIAKFTFFTFEGVSQDSNMQVTIGKACHKTSEIISGIRLVNSGSKELTATIYGVE